MDRVKPIRVKVPRESLIQALERKQNQCKREFEKYATDENHVKRVAEWKTKTLAEMEREIAELKKQVAGLRKAKVTELIEQEGGDYRYATRQQRHPFPFNRERSPEQVIDGYSNVIRMLRLSEDKTVTLTEDQFSAYMDGCMVPARRY